MSLLYFMRHGQAESGAGKPDEDRQLTAEGHRQAEAAGRLLAALRQQPAVILCSPRTRATQTAEHVALALGLSPMVREAVNFSFSTEAVRESVRQHPNTSLMFVGHQPSMSQVIGEITRARVVMETGSMACVYVDHDVMRGELVWFVPPSIAGALG